VALSRSARLETRRNRVSLDRTEAHACDKGDNHDTNGMVHNTKKKSGIRRDMTFAKTIFKGYEKRFLGRCLSLAGRAAKKIGIFGQMAGMRVG
jgi:hypothetical protein